MQSAVLSHHTSGHTCHLVVKNCSLSTSSITGHTSSLLPRESKAASVRKQAERGFGVHGAPRPLLPAKFSHPASRSQFEAANLIAKKQKKYQTAGIISLNPAYGGRISGSLKPACSTYPVLHPPTSERQRDSMCFWVQTVTPYFGNSRSSVVYTHCL